MYIHTAGGRRGVHSTSRKTHVQSYSFSLGGTTGMTVSDKMICLLEDLGNSFERVQKNPPLHDVGEQVFKGSFPSARRG